MGQPFIYNKELVTVKDIQNFPVNGCTSAKYLTPIMYLILSAKCDNIEAFREYVFNHKSELTKTVCSYTPLMLACNQQFCMEEVINILIEASDVNYKIDNEESVLSIIYYNRYFTTDNKINIIRKLINAGINIDLRHNYCETMLMKIAYSKNVEEGIQIAKVLIDAGCNVNLCDVYGYTALMKTTYNMNVSVFKLLIDAGADVNYRHNEISLLKVLSETQLYFTHYTQFSEIIRILLGTNINLTKKYDRDSTGFEFVCNLCSIELVKLCFDTHKYYTEDILLECIKSVNNIEKKKVLLGYLEKVFYEKIDFNII